MQRNLIKMVLLFISVFVFVSANAQSADKQVSQYDQCISSQSAKLTQNIKNMEMAAEKLSGVEKATKEQDIEDYRERAKQLMYQYCAQYK